MNYSNNSNPQLQVKRSPEFIDFSPKPLEDSVNRMRRQDSRHRFIDKAKNAAESLGRIARKGLASAAIIETDTDTADRRANFKTGRMMLVGAAALLTASGLYVSTTDTQKTDTQKPEVATLDPTELGHSMHDTNYIAVASTYAQKVYLVDPTANAYDFAYESLIESGHITVDSDDATFEIVQKLDRG